jgi:hypothetical protein
MGLTNGAKGLVHSIIYAEGSKPPEVPVAVIGAFKLHWPKREGNAWKKKFQLIL